MAWITIGFPMENKPNASRQAHSMLQSASRGKHIVPGLEANESQSISIPSPKLRSQSIGPPVQN